MQLTVWLASRLIGCGECILPVIYTGTRLSLGPGHHSHQFLYWPLLSTVPTTLIECSSYLDTVSTYVVLFQLTRAGQITRINSEASWLTEPWLTAFTPYCTGTITITYSYNLCLCRYAAYNISTQTPGTWYLVFEFMLWSEMPGIWVWACFQKFQIYLGYSYRRWRSVFWRVFNYYSYSTVYPILWSFGQVRVDVDGRAGNSKDN